MPLCLWAKKYELAICAIFQNDAPYLKEWIEFHKIQGVKHFYLYNNRSEDKYLAVLLPYIYSREVTLVQWDKTYDHANGQAWTDVQCGAYEDCIQKFGLESNWLAILDTDEFLYCPDGKKLTKFLKQYEKYAGVCVNWLMFGTSHVYDIPKKRLMIEVLTRCAEQTNMANFHVKSIVRPELVSRCKNQHYCHYKLGGYALDANFRRVDGAYTQTVLLDKIRINHYWSRTEKFLNEYKIPRRNAMYGEDGEPLRRQAEEYNQAEDKAILQFVKKLRSAMQSV